MAIDSDQLNKVSASLPEAGMPDAAGQQASTGQQPSAASQPEAAGSQPDGAPAPADHLNSFISIKEVARISRGRTLRLQNEDVIIAIDGQIFQGSIDEFLDILDECDEETGLLLTIWRKGVIYNVIARGPLGGTLEHCNAETAEAVSRDFAGLEIGNREDYHIYEVLRDLHRNADIIDTRPSQLAVLLPPAWLVQNRLWEPLLAVIAIYGVTISFHWIVFVISAGLLGVYFKQAQIALLRSFAIYRDKQMWLIVAARSMEEAQLVVRQFDPKMNFRNSLVGAPQAPEEAPRKKRRRSSIPAAA